jgi:hypothetical protein
MNINRLITSSTKTTGKKCTSKLLLLKFFTKFNSTFFSIQRPINPNYPWIQNLQSTLSYTIYNNFTSYAFNLFFLSLSICTKKDVCLFLLFIHFHNFAYISTELTRWQRTSLCRIRQLEETLRSLGYLARNVSFLETVSTGDTDIILVPYSAVDNCLPSRNQFRCHGNAVSVNRTGKVPVMYLHRFHREEQRLLLATITF